MGEPIRVVELFAGVGGFRYGLNKASSDYETVWANQWEPVKKAQHAFNCYQRNYGEDSNCVNADIATVKETVPEHDLLVGGFPCQSYSIANSNAKGIEGNKGVLWWEIRDILEARLPSYILLENVDRLLKSPVNQRGRDYGVMLRCLADLGYTVEWRVINAAEYGHPQKRRRVFILGVHSDSPLHALYDNAEAADIISGLGVLSDAFPVDSLSELTAVDIVSGGFADPVVFSNSFVFPFANAGLLRDGVVRTGAVTPFYSGKYRLLGDVLEGKGVDPKYLLGSDTSPWAYLKGSKRLPRTRKDGSTYMYTEGAIPFPDKLDSPARTMLTSEGARSRTTHVVKDPASGELRKLTPLECERINEFPDNWTQGMPDAARYFCMGNALVTGVVTSIGKSLHDFIQEA